MDRRRESESVSCSVMSNSLWAHQAPLCMEFCRQESWSGLPFRSPGDLPDPGVELLEPCLENFEHYPTSMWDEHNCVVVWTFLCHCLFLGIGMKTDLFQICGNCWVFKICWHIECSTFVASSFRIWNTSTGISSPPLALFIVMLPKSDLT